MAETRKGLAKVLVALGAATTFLWMPANIAQQGQAVPQENTCTMDPDGTAHITRVVPVPGTISPEAQKSISPPGPPGPEPTLAERRTRTDAFRTARSAEARKLYPVNDT